MPRQKLARTLSADSVRRFFQSKLEDSALKAKGTYDLKVQKQRRKNRIVKEWLGLA